MIIQTLPNKIVPRQTATMIDVFNGESNSGGQALISELPANMAGFRSPLILNNQTLKFEKLHIGNNNMMQHYVMPTFPWGPFTFHGWEAGVADMVDDGTMKANTTIVKTGQGGSTIYWWGEGVGNYPGADYNAWDKFKERVDAAVTLFNPTGLKFRLWYTQGINDGVYYSNNGGVFGSTEQATWKSSTIAHFNKIRARYGNVPIVMTKLMSSAPFYAEFNVLIEQICAELPNTFFVETEDITREDIYHWDSSGMRVLARRMFLKFAEHGFGN